ncbi:MAG: aminoglycoside phosphotransferase family protein [Planctomycetota bacterium]
MILRRQAALERLGDYVRSRLLPALGLENSTFTLGIPPEGTRSVVLMLEAGSRRFVVKCFSSFLRAAQTVLATRHLTARGAPVPNLCHYDLSPLTRMKVGFLIVVEEAIDGKNLYELERSDAHLRTAARALARLHMITRETWGSLLPGLGKSTDHFEFMQSRLERRLDDLRMHSPEYGEVVSRSPFRAWFESQHTRSSAALLDRYSLCHLRITDTNILLTRDGRAFLIDLVTARYGHHAVDLERALYRWCEHVAGKERVFLEEYFSHFTLFAREVWEQGRSYHKASFHLTQAYRAAKEIRKFSLMDGKHYKKIRRRRRNLARHMKRLLKVMSNAPDGPEESLIEEAREQVRSAARVARGAG